MISYSFLFVLTLFFCSVIYAAGGHEHGSAATDAVKGPHGGRLLQEADFTLEITIYEQGVPPEMRV